jgi:hypothetical protein
MDWFRGDIWGYSMRCFRIAAGGFALLASVVNASAQSCLIPGACQASAGKRELKALGFVNSTQNMKPQNNVTSQKGSLHSTRSDPRRLSAAQPRQQLSLSSQRVKMLDQEKQEPLFKEPRKGNQSSPRTDQAARDALFDEFLRWRVHELIVE